MMKFLDSENADYGLRTLNTIVMATISIASLREWISVAAGLMAIITAAFTLRHYWYQTKIAKAKLKADCIREEKLKNEINKG